MGDPMPEMRTLRTAQDVTQDILDDAEQVYNGWFAGVERIDWDDFIDRLSDQYGPRGNPPYEFETYDDPAVNKVKRYIRQARAS
jgi:hypothetical protein